MKLNVLAVNPYFSELKEWTMKLEKSGYKVISAAENLYDMVAVLSRNKVHIVVCSVFAIGSSAMIKETAYGVFASAMRFFPRVKIVLVGPFISFQDLPKLTNVVLKSKFDCNLKTLSDFPDNADDAADNLQAIRKLLDENFLSDEDAEKIVSSQNPQWIAHFALIAIVMPTGAGYVTKLINQWAAELSVCAVIDMDINEVCVLLDKSPDFQRCLSTADKLREMILSETDATFSIGISRMREKAGELFACRKEALRAADAYGLYGIESVIHIDYIDRNDLWYVYPSHKEKRMIELALAGNTAAAIKMLDEIFEFLKARFDLRERYINKVAIHIWAEMNLAVVSQLPAFEAAQTEAMSFGKLIVSKTLDDAHSFLKNGIQKFSDEMREIQDIKRETLFLELVKRKNSGGEITVSQLTTDLHTTVGYLNDAIVSNSGSKENVFTFF